jgi:hypothetical protein
VPNPEVPEEPRAAKGLGFSADGGLGAGGLEAGGASEDMVSLFSMKRSALVYVDELVDDLNNINNNIIRPS